MIAPNKSRRKTKTQDGRALRRYRRRWHIERLFAWMLRFRRLVTRYEHHARNFSAFTKLACVVILVRTARPARKSWHAQRLAMTRLSDAL
jgi:transposase